MDSGERSFAVSSVGDPWPVHVVRRRLDAARAGVIVYTNDLFHTYAAIELLDKSRFLLIPGAYLR